MIIIEENQGQNPNQSIEKKTSTAKILGIIALVISIIGLLLSFTIIVLPIIIISLILSIIALVKSKGLDDGSKIIAIVALVISILSFLICVFFIILAYFTVLNPGNLLPQKCEFTSGLDCVEAPYADSSAGTISIAIINSNGYEITNIALDSSTTCKKAVSSTDPLANGASATITLSDCSLVSGERFYEDVVITYFSKDTGMTSTATGLLSGKAI